jgi:hypothetical protein
MYHIGDTLETEVCKGVYLSCMVYGRVWLPLNKEFTMSNWGEDLYYQSVVLPSIEKSKDDRVECTHCDKLFTEGTWDHGVCPSCQDKLLLEEEVIF